MTRSCTLAGSRGTTPYMVFLLFSFFYAFYPSHIPFLCFFFFLFSFSFFRGNASKESVKKRRIEPAGRKFCLYLLMDSPVQEASDSSDPLESLLLWPAFVEKDRLFSTIAASILSRRGVVSFKFHFSMARISCLVVGNQKINLSINA